jgi:hypothetical protein
MTREARLEARHAIAGLISELVYRATPDIMQK